jgi:hypothetical protein
MSESTEQPKEKFAPKQPVTLNPPKDDVIERDYLAKCDGMASQWLASILGLETDYQQALMPVIQLLSQSRYSRLHLEHGLLVQVQKKLTMI